MLNRLRGLFQRYARQHRHIEAEGFAPETLSDADADQIALSPRGHVDRVVLAGTQVTFIGWTTADRVLLSGSDGQSVTRPAIRRQDVADALDLHPMVGFEITQSYGTGDFTLTLESGSVSMPCAVTPIPVDQLRRNRRRLVLQFAGTVLRLLPDLVAAQLRHDPRARTRIKRALGLHAVVPVAAPLDGTLFAPPPAEDENAPNSPVSEPDPTPITLILPVYNAFDLLPEVLDRVLRHTDLPWHLIVIEDCSSDADLRPWLSEWVATQEARTPGRITLILNEANKGFIGSVNVGLTRAAGIGNHVVLLNSDAFVPAAWASRLLRPILQDPEVASVTPMSNDAEILTVPVISTPTPLEPGAADALDALAGDIRPDLLPDLPTGVGFCMAMNIAYIRKIPQLDTVFGRGYGEEVDWCQKARALGGRHVALPSLFVEHRGGTSFGSAEKLRLVMRNNQIIADRYPPYDAEVQAFIAADPLTGPRLALGLAWAAGRTRGAIPIYLAHALGGGAESYLQRRIADDLAAGGGPAVVLRVGGGVRWQIELISDQGVLAGSTDDFALVTRLLAPLTRRRIVYSCGVGDPDPAALPGYLLALRTGPQDRIEVLVHDFFMLSPSYTLLDADGVYRGPLHQPRADSAHETFRMDGTPLGCADWQAAWHPLMQAAEDIVVFSGDSRDQILAVWPDLAGQVRLRPHQMLADVPRVAPGSQDRQVIGVLGNIGYQKGAAVVAAMGRILEAGGQTGTDPGLVLIGNVDPAYMPPPLVQVHGDYRIADLPGLVARYGITDWLIPSVWPETFSYTTHECLATGLPVHAFDIGAQGAAVAAAQNGHVIAFAPESDMAETALARAVLAKMLVAQGAPETGSDPVEMA